MTQTTSAATGAEEIEKELREAAADRHRVAWSRTDGGQEWTLAAMLAERAADAIAALRDGNEHLCDLVRQGLLQRDRQADALAASRQREEKLTTLIREAADQCERWAQESRSGGWSTHQVDANQRLASRLRAALSEKPASHMGASVQDAQSAISREREARARADADRTTCSGYEDPEDRCPRKPSECICWQDRTTDSAEKPAAEKEVG